MWNGIRISIIKTDKKFKKQNYRKESIPERTKDNEFETEASEKAIEKSLTKTKECLEKGTKWIKDFLEWDEKLKLSLPEFICRNQKSSFLTLFQAGFFELFQGRGAFWPTILKSL